MAPSATFIDLFFQFSIFGLLTLSIVLLRKRKIIAHGYTMLSAVVLNFISFVVVMVWHGIMWVNRARIFWGRLRWGMLRQEVWLFWAESG
jgi:uncharacterized membrane protein YozB (DUF420 family)